MARLEPDRFPEQWRELARQGEAPAEQPDPAPTQAPMQLVLLLRCAHHPDRLMRSTSEQPTVLECQVDGCTTTVVAEIMPPDQLSAEVLAELAEGSNTAEATGPSATVTGGDQEPEQ